MILSEEQIEELKKSWEHDDWIVAENALVGAIEDIKNLIDSHEAMRLQLNELKGVIELTQDEYVRQVGAWKIIQRLEEENEEFKAKLETCKEAIQFAVDGMYIGDSYSEKAFNKLRECLEMISK